MKIGNKLFENGEVLCDIQKLQGMFTDLCLLNNLNKNYTSLFIYT